MKNKLLPIIILFTLVNIGIYHIITDVPFLFSSFALGTTAHKIITVTLLGGFHIVFILWNVLYNLLAYNIMKNNREMKKFVYVFYLISYVVFVLLSYLVVPLDSFIGIIYAFIGTCVAYYLISITKKEKSND